MPARPGITAGHVTTGSQRDQVDYHHDDAYAGCDVLDRGRVASQIYALQPDSHGQQVQYHHHRKRDCHTCEYRTPGQACPARIYDCGFCYYPLSWFSSPAISHYLPPLVNTKDPASIARTSEPLVVSVWKVAGAGGKVLWCRSQSFR